MDYTGLKKLFTALFLTGALPPRHRHLGIAVFNVGKHNIFPLFPGNGCFYSIAKQITRRSGFLVFLQIALLITKFNSCSSYVKKCERKTYFLFILGKLDNI